MKINITEEFISGATRGCPTDCMVARGLKAQDINVRAVLPYYSQIQTNEGSFTFIHDEGLAQTITNWDMSYEVKPFEVKMDMSKKTMCLA